MDEKDILPSSIHDDVAMRENSGEYLYLDAIRYSLALNVLPHSRRPYCSFIKSIKRGAPFAETSPMLNDIR